MEFKTALLSNITFLSKNYENDEFKKFVRHRKQLLVLCTTVTWLNTTDRKRRIV